jgi:hypothetical protein
MSSKRTKSNDSLNLTREESESMGVAFPEEPAPVPADLRERPLHEQVVGSLTEDEVTEALTGEVTLESREDVEDLFADLQEEEADRQAD